MFRSLGLPEILLILVIILIVFGVGKLPQVGGAIGKAIHNFKKAQAGEDIEEEEKKKPAAVSKSATDAKEKTPKS